MPLFTSKNMLLLEPKHFQKNKIIHPLFGKKLGMILVGALWCPHCVAEAPTWKDFKRISESDPNFIVGAIDAVKFPELATTLNVEGFPTIFQVSKSGQCKLYKGDRDILSLVRHLCKMNSRNNVCIKK